jgi:hypothetical protein|tara:strand:+ start:93 stop:308 length:216 start_codon:yes stop_codon:yes gene_type:complete
MKKQERRVGDLINVMGTCHLGVILKIHDKAGASKFYLVHDNITNKEKWLHEKVVFDASCYNPNVELLNNEA